MYAIIESGGKQYKVKQGDVIEVERIPQQPGEKFTIDRVLAIHNGQVLETNPNQLQKVKVEAECVEHFRGEKLIVFKMKRRKGYRRRHGHRQELSSIRIVNIHLG